jgi:hypothetical protein
MFCKAAVKYKTIILFCVALCCNYALNSFIIALVRMINFFGISTFHASIAWLISLVAMSMDLWMMSFSDFLDDGIESVMLVGSVRNDACCAISFVQSVFAFHDISVSDFPLAFVVASVRIFHSIFEFVFWVSVIIFMMMFWCINLLTVMCDFFMYNWNLMVMMWIIFVIDFCFVSNRWEPSSSKSDDCDENLRKTIFNKFLIKQTLNFQLTANDFIIFLF